MQKKYWNSVSLYHQCVKTFYHIWVFFRSADTGKELKWFFIEEKELQRIGAKASTIRPLEFLQRTFSVPFNDPLSPITGFVSVFLFHILAISRSKSLYLELNGCISVRGDWHFWFVWFLHHHHHLLSLTGDPRSPILDPWSCFSRKPSKATVSYAPINGLPQDGGVGQPRGNLTFSGFEMSISPPLGLHCK